MACAAVGMTPAAAQDDLASGGPERCITLTRLDKTEIIDDRTIIFMMRGGAIYLNHLARECPGLKREEHFMYSPTSNRLCDIDTVTVLEQWGFGLTRGFTCALGVFHPISEAELEDLRNPVEGESSGAPGDGEFEVVPVEPPLDDEDDSESESEN
jgi:hypothetical protein